MSKTILVTGSTDGLGLATAKMLLSLGHNILLHGRNSEKLQKVQTELTGSANGQVLDSYVADLSRMDDVVALGPKLSLQKMPLRSPATISISVRKFLREQPYQMNLIALPDNIMIMIREDSLHLITMD